MENTQKVSFGGVITFWSLSELTDCHTFAMQLEAAGFKDYAPEPRSADCILRESMELSVPKHAIVVKDTNGTQSQAKPEESRYLIRPLAGWSGYSIVKETAGEKENGYETILAVGLLGEELVVSKEGDLTDQVRYHYSNRRGTLRAAQVTSVMTKIINDLGGVRLREHGGIYWLAGYQYDTWAKVKVALESSGSHKVHRVTHSLDTDSIQAIGDALTKEITTEVEDINAKVMGGDYGERGLRNQEERARGLFTKVRDYETILGVSLKEIGKKVAEAEAAACRAALMASASTIKANA